MKYLVAMKFALAMVGWVFVVGGVCLFIGASTGGLDDPANAALTTPSATFVLAGAVLVLASVVAGHAELRGQPQAYPYRQG